MHDQRIPPEIQHPLQKRLLANLSLDPVGDTLEKIYFQVLSCGHVLIQAQEFLQAHSQTRVIFNLTNTSKYAWNEGCPIIGILSNC